MKFEEVEAMNQKEFEKAIRVLQKQLEIKNEVNVKVMNEQIKAADEHDSKLDSLIRELD